MVFVLSPSEALDQGGLNGHLIYSQIISYLPELTPKDNFLVEPRDRFKSWAKFSLWAIRNMLDFTSSCCH